jgi:hAT family C-terminal dimerisation region
MKKDGNFSADFVSQIKYTLQLYCTISIAPNATTMLDAAVELRQLHAVFPRVLKLFQIAFILPVSTASCKRSFSYIKRVKMYARTIS